jgi:hypothetical protein
MLAGGTRQNGRLPQLSQNGIFTRNSKLLLRHIPHGAWPYAVECPLTFDEGLGVKLPRPTHLSGLGGIAPYRLGVS